MVIKSIRLIHFRNYRLQEIDVGPDINIFHGPNAQGKTNILEAVYLCACARSHRTAKDSDLILHGEHDYGVRLDYATRQGVEETLELRYFNAVPADPRRTRAVREIYHNGIKLEKISDLMGLFHAVIFAPEDLMLIKEGPAIRRRYLDLLISQVRPAYFVHLQQFTRILSQRNRLLKQWRDQKNTLSQDETAGFRLQMTVWDDALAREAGAIMALRQQTAHRIGELAAKAQEQISEHSERLTVHYRTVSGLDLTGDQTSLAAAYQHKLAQTLPEDLDRGLTQHGPHRDDLELKLNGSSLKTFASQGQQRSAVLALKLAELHILRQDTGQTPVFLLDDVMSELDEKRRLSLLQNISDAQVFVTCTDLRQVQVDLQREEQAQSQSRPQTVFSVLKGQVTQDGSDPALPA